MRAAERRVLRWLARVERPAAWGLVIGAFLTFCGTVAGLIAHGEVKWATLLISADLCVSGWSALQDAADEAT